MTAGVPTEIISEQECAELVGVHIKTLQRARLRGQPVFPFVEVGRQIRYSKAVVLSCFAEGKCFTSSTGNASADLANPLSATGQKRRGRPRKRS